MAGKIKYPRSAIKGVTAGTRISITASCDPDHEIIVTTIEGHDRSHTVLQDGDSCEAVAYDDRLITIREAAK